jgi:hypothetical protein
MGEHFGPATLMVLSSVKDPKKWCSLARTLLLTFYQQPLQ